MHDQEDKNLSEHPVEVAEELASQQADVDEASPEAPMSEPDGPSGQDLEGTEQAPQETSSEQATPSSEPAQETQPQQHDDLDTLAADPGEFEEVGTPETKPLDQQAHVASNAELDALISSEEADSPLSTDEHDKEAATPEPPEQASEEEVSEEIQQSAIDSMAAGIEALVFASGSAISKAEIKNAFAATWKENTEQERTGFEKLLKKAFIRFAKRWEDGRGANGFQLVEMGGGWVFRSNAEHADLIRTMRTEKPMRLSRAALEVLSIVAYRQPATKAEVDYVRGVDCGGTLRGLLDRGLVKIVGKKDEPGRPLLYGTTHRFLSLFNLGTLRQLPTLREYHELNEDSAEKLREFDGFPTIEELKENMSGISEGSDDVVDDLDDAMVALGKQEDVARDALATEGISLVDE